MKPVITKFNDKTGDFEITIPKYEDIKDYNVFDLIKENQELKKQLKYCINQIKLIYIEIRKRI